MTARRLIARLVVGGLIAAVLSPVVANAANAAIDPPGTPYTFGSNDFGQLGNGTTTDRFTAGPVTGLTNAVDIAGGREHILALLPDGTVRSWGSNDKGQLGIGGAAGGTRTTPVAVPGLTNVVSVATGHYHSLALRSDGSIWTWGYNYAGMLGDGTTTTRTAPVKVSGTATYKQIGAGRDMSYGVRTDGTVWAWGLNNEGQLGDGTLTQRTTPVRVGTLTDVTSIAGGRDHGLAVRSDGTVWTWGSNDFGQIGDGTTTDRLAPVQVTTGGRFVEAGAHHSFVLRTDGTVWSWGRNYRSELGDGTTTQRLRPVQVVNLSNVVEVGSGRDTGIAVLADGTVRSWGNNVSGQLGDGTTTSRTRPVVVPGITNARLAGGGEGYSVVLTSAGQPPPNVAPVARLTSNCSGLTCSFSATTSTDSDGMIVNYAWTFGDGGTDTGITPQAHPYQIADTYTVTLTVTDDDGAANTATTSVTVAPVPNVAPVARITSNCSGLTCSFSATTSTDSDGMIVNYAWTFGDGGTDTGITPQAHPYQIADTYTVTLTVTDDDGAANTATTSVTVAPLPPSNVAFRAATSANRNATSNSVTVPAAVQTGDRLVLFLTANADTTATTPSGWTLLGTRLDGTDLRTWAYTRAAVAGTAGSTVSITLGAQLKSDMTLVAYSGAGPVTVAVSANEAGTSTTHAAPPAAAPAGSRAVAYWADKTAGHAGWTLPAELTARASSALSGSGTITAAAGETATLPAGTWPGATATSGVASGKAIAWTVIVPAS